MFYRLKWITNGLFGELPGTIAKRKVHRGNMRASTHNGKSYVDNNETPVQKPNLAGYANKDKPILYIHLPARMAGSHLPEDLRRTADLDTLFLLGSSKKLELKPNTWEVYVRCIQQTCYATTGWTERHHALWKMHHEPLLAVSHHAGDSDNEHENLDVTKARKSTEVPAWTPAEDPLLEDNGLNNLNAFDPAEEVRPANISICLHKRNCKMCPVRIAMKQELESRTSPPPFDGIDLTKGKTAPSANCNNWRRKRKQSGQHTDEATKRTSTGTGTPRRKVLPAGNLCTVSPCN